MKKSFRITSKYLVERSGFFSKTQLVLSLQENYLQLQPLSDREEKDGGVTRIEWDSILSAQASERNPKEFTLSVLPSNHKKKSGSVQVNKANAQQQVYMCRERNRLLTEIQHKLHIHNDDGKPYLVEKVWHQTDIYKEKSKKLVSLRIHPTVIQVVLRSTNNEKKKIGPSSQFATQAQKDIMKAPNNQPQIQEENKRLFSDGEEESSLYEPGYVEEFDDEQEEELQAYESEGQINILTPYKGSMLGGTIIGEESALQGTVNVDQTTNQQSASQHFIYLSEIEKVYSYPNTLIIIKKNQEIEKFIFRTDEKNREFVNWMRKNFATFYKNILPVVSFESFQEQEQILNELGFLKRESKSCYSQEISSFTWDGMVSGLQIELDENYIYEIDKAKDKVRKKCLLKDLEIIRINDKSNDYNMVLLFKKELEMVVLVPSSNERERLISAILTLRNFVIPQQGYLDQLIILLNSPLDYSQKIYGLDPFEQQQYIQDYENLLFRKLCENINYKDNMKINNIIEEALLNATFGSLLKIDQGNVKTIVKETQQTLETYLHCEYCEYQQNDILQKQSKSNLNANLMSNTVGVDNSTTQQNIMYNEDAVERQKQIDYLFDRLSKYLNALCLFLNSKTVLNDMAEYDELMLLLIKLLGGKSPYMALLASQVLKAMIQHYSGNESKSETINKRIMIRGKQHIQSQGQGALESQQNAQVNQQYDLGESLYLIQAIKEYLILYDNLYENSNQIKSLNIFSIGNILRSILMIRRSSTGKEELKIFADMINEDDPIFLQYLEEEKSSPKKKNFSSQQLEQSPTKGHDRQERAEKQSLKLVFKERDNPLRHKPMFHLIDKFSLLGFEYFDIQYLFSMILNETFGYYKKYEIDKLLQFQQYTLTYSVQFIWQLFLQMESEIKEQRKLSIQILSKILYQNSDAIHLLLRCYPKTLIEKVHAQYTVNKWKVKLKLMNKKDTSRGPFSQQQLMDNVASSTAWQDQEWDEFFQKITYQNYDSATEQWNDETRNELKQRLQQELYEFLDAKKTHKQIMQDDTKQELVLPNHEFNRNKKVISRYKNLKWNYMEFGVKYICLNSKFLVWKYYLTKLLVENNLDETQRPYFTQKEIEKPLCFWQELKIKFMSSFDPKEHIIILKTMCVLYNRYYQQLKEIKFIPYFLKLFEQQQYEHCHFILLQLMHVALSIDREYAIKNMKKFIKSDGLIILINQLKLVFKELLRPDRGNKIENNPQLLVLSTVSRDQFEKVLNGEGVLVDRANYTNSNTNSRYFKRNSENICTGIISLKILDLIFKEMWSIDYVPLPANREFLLQHQSLAILTQILMVENVDLTRELTIFILTHMNNHYSFYRLKNYGMIEFLILCLGTRNGDRALEILEKFQEVSFDYNSHLKIGRFKASDLKMIQDDREKFGKLAQSAVGGEEITQQDQQQQMQQQQIISPNEAMKNTILPESVLLRFLPIPFIKFLYEQGQQKFLEVYKMNFYESPILIWNAELRKTLEDSIKENAEELIKKLQEFAQQPNFELKQQQNIPTYDKKFKYIVAYPQIENEVICGRYYLRVWINQNPKSPNFFDIPPEEEDEFYKNLQAELRYCIYKEHLMDQQKIIILFKSCLLALQRFQKKKELFFSEVYRILLDTCKNAPVYNETIKQIIYIGMKIVYQVVRAEIITEIFNLILKYSFNSKNTQTMKFEDGNEIEVQNSQTDVENIIVDRIETKTLILCIQSINIILNSDIFNLRTQDLNTGNSIQAFVDFPLSQRILLFRQISRLLDLSFTLLPLFKDKKLTNQLQHYDSKTYSSYQQAPIMSSGTKKRKDKSRKKSQHQRNKSLKKNNFINTQQAQQLIPKSYAQNTEAVKRSQINASQNQYEDINNLTNSKYDKKLQLDVKPSSQKRTDNSISLNMINQLNQTAHYNQGKTKQAGIKKGAQMGAYEFNNNMSGQNPYIGQAFNKGQNQQFNMEFENYNLNNKKIIRTKKQRIYQRDANIDYSNNTLLQIIAKNMDKYSIELILDLSRNIFEFTKEITKNPVLHPEIIVSGMAWKALKFIYFQLKEETSQFQDLRASLREATVTLKNLISFSAKFQSIGTESYNQINNEMGFLQMNNNQKKDMEQRQPKSKMGHYYSFTDYAFQNLASETEKEIMDNFWKCIKALLSKKIQDTLICQFVMINNEQVFTPYDPRIFLQQFSVREETSPELVWNNETRFELFSILESQINNLHYSYFDKIITFEYSVYKRELRVNDIFVRHFNNQNEFKPQDIENFAQKLIEKLKEYIELKYIADLTEQEYNNCIELFKAFKHLLINENLFINNQEQFEDYLSIFCNIIQLKPENEQNFNQNVSQSQEQQMLKDMSYLVLEIISHISKSGGEHFIYLKGNHDFHKLLIRSLHGKEKDIIDPQQIIMILQNMLNSKEIEIQHFLINTGLIMFILNQIFEKKAQNDNMKERIELVKLIIQANMYTQPIYSKYIPQYFFVEFQSKQINDPETEKIIEFLRELDSHDFENVFIIWNSNLKKESHQRIKNNCEQIVQNYEDSTHQVKLDLQDLYNPYLEHEIMVKDVIIRIYNKNPAVFINVKLNSFILSLSQQLQIVAQKLFKLGQQQQIQQLDDFQFYDDIVHKDPVKQAAQKGFKALCKQSLLLLTALLLSIEQLLLNDFNPNRLMANKKEDKNAENKFYKQIIEKTTDQTQLDHKVYSVLGFWLQTQVFLTKHIPVEIRLTFLQIIFLVIDVADAIKVLNDNQSLMQFITDSIAGIQKDRFQKTLEEALILLITQKMLRKGSEPTPILIIRSMKKLFRIYEKKKKLKKLIEFILALMASDLQYKQSVIEYVKQNQQTVKIDTKLIFEGRHENSENTEAIMRIWRGKPSSTSDAKRYYDVSECYFIEDKLEETNIPKLKLPLLSKKSVYAYKKEELFFEAEPQKDNKINKNRLLGESDAMLPVYPQAPLTTKEVNKLDFQPILDHEDILGGDIEQIEPIEKKSEDSFSDYDGN